jgi:hypothetical protein
MQRPQRQQRQRPDPWRRHRRELLGLGVLLAAFVVVLWPGPLPVLALVALGLATVLAGVVAIMVYLALRRPR